MNKKLSRKPMDITEETIDQLKKILPAAFTEDNKVDFDRLKQLLGEHVDSSPERFGLSWFGKSDAIKTMQQVSKGTLRPVVEKSANFDEAENIIIEGDNLEVLKLLQKAYYNKVKMIYIDPPYNRKDGNDLIYEDNFSEPIKSYLKYTGQIDENGDAVSSNTEKNGRRHSKWLSMMYPRLYLARNLLRDDGVIFVSIDDNEQARLKAIMDEIFGEENFLTSLTRRTKTGGGSAAHHFAVEHDFVLAYGKDKDSLEPLYVSHDKDYIKRYSEEDEKGKYFWDTMERSYTQTKPYKIEAPDGQMLEGKWFRSEERFKRDKEEGEIRFVKKDDGSWSVQFKQRLPKGKKIRSILSDNEFKSSQEDLAKLDLEGAFDFPKPVHLIKYFAIASTSRDDIILDFFAGSGTTAHAVMALNKEDEGNRSYIMVQLPEPVEHEKFNTIADITRERIIRAAEQLKVEPSFKYFKLDSSNFTEWNEDLTTAEEINEQLEAMLNPIKEGRTQLDLLYEVLLKGGFPLTTPIKKHNCKGKTFYGVERSDGELLLIYLETEIVDGLVEQMLSLNPKQVIFLDECFQNDVEKKNMQYEFEEFHHTKVEFTSI